MTQALSEEPSPQPRSAAAWLPYIVILSVLLLIGLITLSANRGLPEINNVTVFSSLNDKPVHVNLPYSREGKHGEKLTFDMSLTYKASQPTMFNVVADDCVDHLVINAKEVVLEGDALKNRCNWSSGFSIDLKPYLKEGVNDVHVEIENYDGPTGLRFSPASAD